MADEFLLSEHHFIHKFHKIFGMPPIRFIREEKVRNAQYLLTNTTNTVNEIAEQLAFSDAGYFSKVFRSITGLTPSKYRQNNGNPEEHVMTENTYHPGSGIEIKE